MTAVDPTHNIDPESTPPTTTYGPVAGPDTKGSKIGVSPRNRSQWITDPRPDLVRDSPAWGYLLVTAFDAFPQPHRLFGALHFVRCIGAQIEKQGDTLIILAPGIEAGTEYDYAATYVTIRPVLGEYSKELVSWLKRGARYAL